MTRDGQSNSTSETWGVTWMLLKRARADTLAMRVTEATSQVHMVSALPFGFFRLIGLMAGLCGSEGAEASSKSHDSFLSGIVRAYWPRKLPMAYPHAVLIPHSMFSVSTNAKVPWLPSWGNSWNLPTSGFGGCGALWARSGSFACRICS